MDHSKRNLALAATAAALFAIAPVSASAAEEKVQCMGVNACKGKSSCKTASSSCKGQNSCKGHGFVLVTQDVCDQLGGKTD
jgi:uncharacterized membrane protein